MPDHLDLLNYYDKTIKAVRESGWLEALATKLPKPAGYLARSQSTGPGDGVCIHLSPEKEQAPRAIIDRHDNRYKYALTGYKHPA